MSSPADGATDLPELIGPYRVIRILGEGGMGTVYEAAETGPVRRNVAVKVVRAGFGSREVRARFEAERQALALMDHAGIAKVLQAGETANGDPFFAMELVKGPPINDFCDSRRLSTNDRLALFISVCQAVQHAHQKGVIHRDLKPTNILVTEQDGKPQPKIIDFGIAKALGLKLSDNTMVTMVGTPIGTAAYMSPEQAESSGIDVDTRTDIYSLGVILYQLLIGSVPNEPTAEGMPVFIYRLASGYVDTPRPSVRFAGLGDYQAGVADARRTTVEHLKRDLSGDLDWIVMKSLEANRSRRYETASALAADINRFLNHEPVTARPPTTPYRLKKFIRRNRTAVAAATFVVLALAVSAVLATAGMIRAVRAERVAAQEAAATRQVSNFLVGLFRIPDAGEAAGSRVTARDLLDRGVNTSQAELAHQPQLLGRMMNTIGDAYYALGLYAPAITTLERALTAKERSAASDSSVAATEIALGDAMARHGDLKPSEQHYSRAIALSNRAPKPNDPLVARELAGLAVLRWQQGQKAEAESLYKSAIAIDGKNPDELLLARHLIGLGVVYWAQKRYPEAEAQLQRALDIQQKKLGPDHPDVATVTNNLGALLWSQGRFDEALPLYERTLKIYNLTYDPSHPNIAAISNNLAETYWKLGRYKEAEPLFRRALAIKEAKLASGHPSIAVTLNGLAGVLRDEKRFAEAEPFYQRALAIRRKALPAGDADIAETANDYATLLRATGRSQLAVTLVSENKAVH